MPDFEALKNLPQSPSPEAVGKALSDLFDCRERTIDYEKCPTCRTHMAVAAFVNPLLRKIEELERRLTRPTLDDVGAVVSAYEREVGWKVGVMLTAPGYRLDEADLKG